MSRKLLELSVATRSSHWRASLVLSLVRFADICPTSLTVDFNYGDYHSWQLRLASLPPPPVFVNCQWSPSSPSAPSSARSHYSPTGCTAANDLSIQWGLVLVSPRPTHLLVHIVRPCSRQHLLDIFRMSRLNEVLLYLLSGDQYSSTVAYLGLRGVVLHQHVPKYEYSNHHA